MSSAVFDLDPAALRADSAAAGTSGARYAETYRAATPYPHICIDGFLPEAVLDHVLEDVATLPEAQQAFDAPQERLKSQFNPDRLPDYSRRLFQAFNARPMLAFLEAMTGIEGLIADPYFMGAGIHRVGTGGHLDIHADFNLHKHMKVERRLNVLIYLNRDWQEEWGGSFEIWDKGMRRKEASFVPLFNRMVCFSTGSDTFHGNPEPVAHPGGGPRLSIALYYYTATWDASRKGHSTLFQPRPGSHDSVDRIEARHRVMADILPPVIYRKLGWRLKRMGI